MTDETSTPPTVHVVTDADLQALAVQIAAQIKAGSPMSVVKATAVQGAEDVLANIKTLVADFEGTVGHVHGAAVQFRTDVKANIVMIAIAAATIFNTVAILFPKIL